MPKANFTKIASGIPVKDLSDYLKANPQLWLENTIRQSFPDSPHIDTECIFVRGPSEFSFEEYQGTIDAQAYKIPDDLAIHLHNVFRVIDTLMPIKEVGYILIVNLLAGGEVFPHRDEGVYAEYYDRYHLVIDSAPGNSFYVNDEEAIMNEGELWTFNHRAQHSVVNFSTEDRIHIIFDVK